MTVLPAALPSAPKEPDASEDDDYDPFASIRQLSDETEDTE